MDEDDDEGLDPDWMTHEAAAWDAGAAPRDTWAALGLADDPGHPRAPASAAAPPRHLPPRRRPTGPTTYSARTGRVEVARPLPNDWKPGTTGKETDR